LHETTHRKVASDSQLQVTVHALMLKPACGGRSSNSCLAFQMVLVGCGVMPHAPMVIKPAEDQIAHLPELQDVHEACLTLADHIRERRPHTIVLVTPHGVTIEQGMTGVYMNGWARGSAEWSSGFSNVRS
jgi:hypothetical protein